LVVFGLEARAHACSHFWPIRFFKFQWETTRIRLYTQALVQQVTVVGARSHGFLLEACQVSLWQHMISQSNGGDGFLIRGANGAPFTYITAQTNDGNGIRMEG
jgi:hypothetical protein